MSTTAEQGVFTTIETFTSCWEAEGEKTDSLLQAIPDKLWHEDLVSNYRTLARLAWHLIQTPSEMLQRTGLKIDGPSEAESVPHDPQLILQAHRDVVQSVAQTVRKNWTDETLQQTDDMYGQLWTRSMTLTSLLHHLIHHRAQMTVLMRIGNAKVPGLYGPALEEWAQFGMTAPEV